MGAADEQRWAPRIEAGLPPALRLLGRLVVATASCALAYWAAKFLVLESVPTLAGVFAEVELHRFRARWLLPGTVTRFPPDVSLALYAVCLAGFLISGAVVILLSLALRRRTQGWLRLLLTQMVLWSALLVALYTAFYAGWAEGPLAAALRALWPAQAVSLGLRIALGSLVAGLVLLASSLALRSFLDGAAETRAGRGAAFAGWLLLPTLLVSYLLTWSSLPLRGIWSFGFAVGPTVLLLLAGVPLLRARPRSAPPLRLTTRGAMALLAVFALSAAALVSWDELARFTRAGDFVEQETRHWRLHVEKAALSRTDLASLGAAADMRLAGLGHRLGLQVPNPRLHAYLYISTATKRALAGSDQPFTLQPDSGSVHHLLAPAGGLTDARGDALLLMQRAWGAPGSMALAEALARYAVGDFYGYALSDYAARIVREERRYRLREVLALEDGYLSPLVRDALGGAWVEFVAERRGAQLLPVLYREALEHGREEVFARALGSSWDALEEDWRRFLFFAAAARAAPEMPRRPATLASFRGISFSHEVGGHWGYGSDRALKELERIRQLGANAVAVVPYAFTRAPRETQIYFATDESDDRVSRTLDAARRLGLATMLKPQLWGPGFTGNIVFKEEAEFERWFVSYRAWLLHMARLAELHQVEVLVVGTELGGVSSREALWRALISDVRRIYSGRLTYAAHWGEEFEGLRFWDALDFLGVNMYYPLAAPGETPRADSPRVKALLEKFAALADKHQRPLLFTEVGYPSLTSAAAEPWVEGQAAFDLELQQRCYETVFEAFAGQKWLAGLFWWKWPSHGGGTRFDPSYNPIGKPAAEVLRRWYSQHEQD